MQLYKERQTVLSFTAVYRGKDLKLTLNNGRLKQILYITQWSKGQQQYPDCHIQINTFPLTRQSELSIANSLILHLILWSLFPTSSINK